MTMYAKRSADSPPRRRNLHHSSGLLAAGLFGLCACGSNTTTNWDSLEPALSSSTLPVAATRTGYLSPAQNSNVCLTDDAQGRAYFAACGANANTTWTLSGQHLADNANNCLTIASIKSGGTALAVSATDCNTGDASQRFAYLGGRYVWVEYPDFCLDAGASLATGTGAAAHLIATPCSLDNQGQLWEMHSAYADQLTSAKLGPYGHGFLPRVDGFLSTDGSATVGLGFERTIMFTQDAFINTGGGTNPNAPNYFLHNLVGSVRCGKLTDPNTCSIKYFYGNIGRTHPIYATGDSSYIWPGDAVMVHGEILSTCDRTITTGGNFYSDGAGMCRVLNPLDSPDLWERQFVTINHNPKTSLSEHIATNPNGVTGTWSSASDNGTGYSYTHYNSGTGSIAVRLPISAQSNPNTWVIDGNSASAWQYLNANNVWSPLPVGGEPNDFLAHTRPTGGQTDWDAKANIYATVGLSSNAYLNEGAFFATGPTITGPWTTSKRFMSFPEYDSSSPDYIHNTFCYNAYPHPEMSPPGQLVYSYYCTGAGNAVPIFRTVAKPW